MLDDSLTNDYQLFVMNPDGSELQQLTYFNNHAAGQPSLSPNGEQIVFATSILSSTMGPSIFIMDSNGLNPRPMKLRADSIPYPGLHPKWSPDGNRLAYHLCVNCEIGGRNYEIFIYDFDSDSVTQITNNKVQDTYPTWSPDGSQIAFISDRNNNESLERDRQSNLYIMDDNGQNPLKITQNGNVSSPEWSPIENLIAFYINKPGNQSFLYNVDTDKIIPIKTNLEFASKPQWGSIGKDLLIYGRKNEASPRELQYFEISKENFILSGKIKDNIFLNEGLDFTWHNN